MGVNVKANILKIVRVLLQYVVPVAALAYVVWQFSQIPTDQYKQWFAALSNHHFWVFFAAIVLLLSAVNWLLEAVKWQILVSNIEQMGLLRSLGGVLYGVGLGLVAPRQVGEFAGRAMVLRKENRIHGLALSTIGSFVQFCITFFMGHLGLLLGVIYLGFSFNPFLSWAVLSYSLGVGLLSMLSVVFYKKTIAWLQIRFKSDKIRQALQAIAWIDKRIFRLILLIGLLRYAIFMFQFYLILGLLGLWVSPLIAVVLLSITYLIMLGLPVSGLVDAGLRGSVALFVLHAFSGGVESFSAAYELAVVAAMLLLWILNLAIPGIVGALIGIKGDVFSKQFLK